MSEQVTIITGIGRPGVSGFSGFSGIGTQGIQGQQGQSGFSGFSGRVGSTGAQGQSGYSGYSGQVGPQGAYASPIVNTNVASNAAIEGTKINPNFGSQDITTIGNIQTNALTVIEPHTADGAAVVLITADVEDRKPLVIQGADGQAVNLFEIQSSNGGVIASVNGAGELGASYISSINGLGVGSNFSVDSNGLILSGILTVNTPATADATANVMIAASDDSHKPLIIQGATGQSANLFEVQNYTGTPLVTIDSNGSIYTNGGLSANGDIYSDNITANTMTSNQSITAGGGNFSVNQYEMVLQLGCGAAFFSGVKVNDSSVPDPYANIMVAASTQDNKPLVIQGASLQSANLLEVQDFDGYILASISPSGSLYAGAVDGGFIATYGDQTRLTVNTPTTSDSTASALISAYDSSHKPLVVQGATGQTANLFEIQNDSGGALMYIDSSGNMTFPSGPSLNTYEILAGRIKVNTPTTPDVEAQVMIYSNGDTKKPLVLQGTDTQTANLFECQDAYGNPIVTVNNSGLITALAFQGDGSALNNLPVPSNLSSGTATLSTGTVTVSPTGSPTALVATYTFFSTMQINALVAVNNYNGTWTINAVDAGGGIDSGDSSGINWIAF